METCRAAKSLLCSLLCHFLGLSSSCRLTFYPSSHPTSLCTTVVHLVFGLLLVISFLESLLSLSLQVEEKINCFGHGMSFSLWVQVPSFHHLQLFHCLSHSLSQHASEICSSQQVCPLPINSQVLWCKDSQQPAKP